MEAAHLQRTGKLSGSHLVFALIIMAQMQLWDGIITQVMVGNRVVNEWNPFVVSFIDNGSFIPLKVIGIILCIAALWFIGKRFPRLVTLVSAVIAVFYTAILAWNFTLLFTA